MPILENPGKICGMNDADSPEKRIGRLAEALCQMAKPLGYGVRAVNDTANALFRLSDGLKACVAILCAVACGKTERRASIGALLDKYESSASHTAFFYDRYGGLEFPGGTPEEIELKAAAGWTAVPVKGQLW